MAYTEIDAAKVSDYTNNVEDFTVDTQQTDSAGGEKETKYINADASQQLGYYKSVPEIKMAIDAKATWTIGTGISADESTASKKQVDQIVISEQKVKEEALAEKKRKEEEQKRTEAEAAKAAEIPIITIPEVPNYSETIHNPVSHPNLIVLSQAQKQAFVDSQNRWRANV